MNNISNEVFAALISGITTLIAAIFTAIYSALKNRYNPINEARYKKAFFPIMCILEKCNFRYTSDDVITTIVEDIKAITTENRLYVGEKFQQYIYDFDNACTPKDRRKAFDFLCEYTIKEINRLVPSLGIPRISFKIRCKRLWFSRYSLTFILRLSLMILFRTLLLMFVFIIFAALTSLILQPLLML